MGDGPGKAIDTDKLFVVASNMLGSTNAGSINPETGEAPTSSASRITLDHHRLVGERHVG
jgi:homoserine acetyltransferase